MGADDSTRSATALRNSVLFFRTLLGAGCPPEEVTTGAPGIVGVIIHDAVKSFASPIYGYTKAFEKDCTALFAQSSSTKALHPCGITRRDCCGSPRNVDSILVLELEASNSWVHSTIEEGQGIGSKAAERSGSHAHDLTVGCDYRWNGQSPPGVRISSLSMGGRCEAREPSRGAEKRVTGTLGRWRYDASELVAPSFESVCRETSERP